MTPAASDSSQRGGQAREHAVSCLPTRDSGTRATRANGSRGANLLGICPSTNNKTGQKMDHASHSRGVRIRIDKTEPVSLEFLAYLWPLDLYS